MPKIQACGIMYIGKLKQAHRNLNAKDSSSLWSYYPQGEKRVRHTSSLFATDVTFKQPSGKKFQVTLNGGKRSVYAWLRAEQCWLGTSTNGQNIDLKNSQELIFNPKKGHRYFQDAAGNRVDSASIVILADNGKAYFQK